VIRYRVRGGGERSELALESSRSDWPVGQAVLDDFILERTLGVGGMGMVYLLQSRSTACDGFRSTVASPNRLSGCSGQNCLRFQAESFKIQISL
jgi:hypothetical protein